MRYKIPPRIRVKANVTYEILWVDSFKDESQMGECDDVKKQIIIRKGLGKRASYYTFLHELIHAIDMENKFGLTEAQVNGLEVEFNRVSRLNPEVKIYLPPR